MTMPSRWSDSTVRGLALAAFAVSALSLASMLVRHLVSGGSWSLADVVGGTMVAMAVLFPFPLVGLLITHREPRNRIGWLMLAIGLLSYPMPAFVNYGLERAPEPLPGAQVVGAFTTAIWAPVLGLVGTFLILLFPDGKLPSRRWRFVGWFSAASIGYVFLLVALAPVVRVPGVPPYPSPFGTGGLERWWSQLLPTIVVLPLSMVLCTTALVQRFRRARGVERLQLKWLVSAGVVVGSTFLFSVLVGTLWFTDEASFANASGPLVWLLTATELTNYVPVLIPLAIGVAIGKHRLYDIDVVLNKALVFGALAAFITALYVAVVVGVGSLLGAAGEPHLGLSIAATALVAVVFQPVRQRVQRFANRLVYGARATPYEVLSDFATRLGGGYQAAELLPLLARAVAQGVGAQRVEVWLAVGPDLVREAAWGPTATTKHASNPVAALADLTADRVVPVRRDGELLGAVAVHKPAGEILTPGEEKLLDQVAAQTALVLRNVRLIEELRGSRQRLVQAQDEERRRLERNLHDGAQQSLVSVALMIRAARGRLSTADATAGPALDEISEQLRLAIEELRELARGIHPALLTERGLEPALRSLAERSPVPVVTDLRLESRPAPAIEAALYFVVAESLANVAKHARAQEVVITLEQHDDVLTLVVADDGVGGADPTRGSGLAGLADRLAVVDGTLEVTSRPGDGTRLTCRIRVPAPAPEVDAHDGRSLAATSRGAG